MPGLKLPVWILQLPSTIIIIVIIIIVIIIIAINVAAYIMANNMAEKC